MDDGAEQKPGDGAGIYEQAASGDLAALNKIAANHYEAAVRAHEPAVIALARAVEFARLAVMRGGRQESVLLIFLLEQHAFALRDLHLDDLADRTHGQAIALAEGMASDGDEEMASMVIAGAGDFTPAAMMVARDMRRALEPVTEH